MSQRVLVIEDQRVNMELMRCLIESAGWTLLAAADGIEGLERARRDRPDVILCDVHLPGLDGYSVARALKAHPNLRRIPLVALTALAMVGDREKLLAAGFDSYISKPIDVSSILSQIRGLLDKRSDAWPAS